MIELGGTHRYEVVTGKPERVIATILYRDPTSDEWLEFQGDLAKSIGDQAEGDAVPRLVYEYGKKIIVGGEDFEPPEGMSVVEAIVKYRPSLVAMVGKKAFFNGHDEQARLGKSDESSAPSSTGGSAESSSETAKP